MTTATRQRGAAAAVAVLDGLSDIDAANVVRCARTLLRRPLLRVDGHDGDLLPLVFRHRVALQELFSSLLGYRLVVQRKFARLYKSGPGPQVTRGEQSLTPRGYAYLALSMAALIGVGRQVLLSRLVAEIRAAAAEAGIEVSDGLPDRRALTAALRHLVALGVITETEGSVAPWTGEAPSEALITVDTDLLGHLLAGPIGEVETPEELITASACAGMVGGERGVEHAVRRRLVEDPVVLHADLPEEQATWLRRHHKRESLLLERCFGLVAEVRLEGVAVTDPEEYLTDLGFPGMGTVARVALLSLPELLKLDEDVEPREDGRTEVSRLRLREVCVDLVESYPSAWSKQATEDVDELVDGVLELLAALSLAVQQDEGTWLISPAAHRWVPDPDASPGRESTDETPEPVVQTPSWSLFDEEST
ncbi:TIGR02678 family protein [Allokutzneria albata]|uniref:TIGR02678 family protein n=1 Tax=Allokutzneria albata TaxID=211114 RepID=A0A1H0CIE6_ALLAB|nr:TIGR02678 family protein [Allokutzneria albata]SDN57551.1 TIGR02678 family protein [Allokutzneria albata]